MLANLWVDNKGEAMNNYKSKLLTVLHYLALAIGTITITSFVLSIPIMIGLMCYMICGWLGLLIVSAAAIGLGYMLYTVCVFDDDKRGRQW